MSCTRIALGKFGEDLACAELVRRGYAILARRYRSRFGEIDIIARDGRTLVFVEVKARHGDAFGAGAESVTFVKRRRIVLLAQEYADRCGWQERPMRFDVVEIQIRGASTRVDVFANAFDAV
jgi:putative endonuclease